MLDGSEVARGQRGIVEVVAQMNEERLALVLLSAEGEDEHVLESWTLRCARLCLSAMFFVRKSSAPPVQVNDLLLQACPWSHGCCVSNQRSRHADDD